MEVARVYMYIYMHARDISGGLDKERPEEKEKR